MTILSCDTVRERLPQWRLEALDSEQARAVEAHLADCQECSREAEVLEALLGARPEPPEGLDARIRARVREEMVAAEDKAASGERTPAIPFRQRRRWAPAWALPAAAVVILALGTQLIWDDRIPEVVMEPSQVATQDPLPEAWLWDDGMVAGAPVFDGLTDEELEALLQEMEG
ncbi:anti-sigma factor family protein [Gemmatimonadota bacterium]